MKAFFLTACHKCGVIDEAKFTYAGPHIKQICNSCGFYIKFFNKSLIPDVNEIKLKIWQLTNADLNIINKCKKDIGFVSDLKGTQLKLMYWRLYLEILDQLDIILLP